MNESSASPRFEVLPVGRSEEEAAQLPEPVRLTVTCSPRHGPDESLDMARRLRRHGHAVTIHLAARMVRRPAHLDELLTGMADAGIDDVFLIGGDQTPPLGPYSSAMELLPLVYGHPWRPREIGVAGYPEGHPLIADEELAEALDRKSACATYITTQMCFDGEAVLGWIARTRERGLTLPVLVGVPGVVGRRRLLEVAMRIGVGPSLAFVRKQRGLGSLLGKSKVMPDPPYEAVASALDHATSASRGSTSTPSINCARHGDGTARGRSPTCLRRSLRDEWSEPRGPAAGGWRRRRDGPQLPDRPVRLPKGGGGVLELARRAGRVA